MPLATAHYPVINDLGQSRTLRVKSSSFSELNARGNDTALRNTLYLSLYSERGLEIAEGRLGRREMQRYQSARRIVDIHQRRACWRPVLEPAVIAAVDHQFTQTRAPGPRLVDLRRALPARYPQSGFRHQVAHRLARRM
jgi:hypothetical protein